MFKWITKLAGDSSEREVRKLGGDVDDINALESEYQALSADELRDKTTEFRGRFLAGETLDDLLPEAFAAVREASRRAIGKRHYDVQLIAGAVLHSGRIAEMKTGEGKTLVATLPLYLSALEGKGAHLVTPNDYLSRLGGGWMGPVYHALGLKVGVIAHEFGGVYDPDFSDPAQHADERLNHWLPVPRRQAYEADITYGTNNEFGFDYLRDNMQWDSSGKVQRELHYAIVDEVDNILIDEARTPLIISGPAEEANQLYEVFARVVRQLTGAPKPPDDEDEPPDADVIVDEKYRVVTPSDEGIDHVEQLLARVQGLNFTGSVYDPQNLQLTHYLDNALKAQFLFQRDDQYIVNAEGEIVIVDEFTGRSDAGSPLLRRSAPGDRSEGGRAHPARERHAGPHHLPELLPDVREAGGHDRHRLDRAGRVPEDLQPRRRVGADAHADDSQRRRRSGLQDRVRQVRRRHRRDPGAAQARSAGAGRHHVRREVRAPARAARPTRVSRTRY